MGRVREIQEESHEWRQRNFPDQTLEQAALGVAEEAGELAHGVLKLQQKIRGDSTVHTKEIIDALGDIFIYMCAVASAVDLDLHECIEDAWFEVKQRDWVTYPDTGLPPRTMGAATNVTD